MGGKKKSATKKKSPAKPSKFVVAEVEPVNTCSKALSVDLVATPPPPPPEDVSDVSGLSLAAVQAALEECFDDRMAQMETSFCSSIASMITSGSVASAKGAVAATPTSMPPPSEIPPRRKSSSSSGAVARAASSRSSRSSSSSGSQPGAPGHLSCLST